MVKTDLLPPPLEQYADQSADVIIPSMAGWQKCTILHVDEVLKNHLWVRDEKGNEHLVPAFLHNFVFNA